MSDTNKNSVQKSKNPNFLHVPASNVRRSTSEDEIFEDAVNSPLIKKN